MQFSDTILLFITALVSTIAAVFCLISLTTTHWSILGGLFCTDCPPASGGLSITAFILLIAAIIILILFALKILPQTIRFLSILILFLATMFTLAAYASYFDHFTGYSSKLMVFAHFLCYIASLLATFWLGGSYVTTVIAPNNP